MNPGRYDIVVQKEGTFGVTLTAQDSLGSVNFAATYNKARLEVYPSWLKPGDTLPSTPLLQMDTESGSIVLDGTRCHLLLSAEDTAELSFTEGHYVLFLINDLVSPFIADPVFKGVFTVKNKGDL
jgi:hypothetical protein